MSQRSGMDPASVDRKLALAFGAVVLTLMLIVTMAAVALQGQQQRSEEGRLSEALASALSESISRVSYSGKYHARLLAEEMASSVRGLEYVSVESRDGTIVAHSDPTKNDTTVTADELARTRLALLRNRPVQAERQFAGNAVREVVQPYVGGEDSQTIGVVRVGVNVDAVRRQQWADFGKLLVLIALLTTLAIAVVFVTSRRFGASVRELATQLQGILRHAPMAIRIADGSGRTLAQSVEYEALAQPGSANAEDATGDHEPLPAHWRRLAEAEADAFSTGVHVQQELEVDLATDHRVWDTSKFPIARDASGRVTAVCTFIRDVTERRQAEDALRESETYNKLLFTSSHLATVVLDPETGRLIDCNPTAVKLFGHGSIDDVLGRTPADMSTPLQYDGTPSSVGALNYIREASEKGSAAFEWQLQRPSGEVWHAECHLVSFASRGRRLLQGSLVDVSARRRAEEALTKRIVAMTQPLQATDITLTDLFDLEEVQKIQDAFADATGVASIITDTDGKPITRPSNFCRLCIDVIRGTEKGLRNCMRSDAAIGRMDPHGPIVQPCLSGGLWDAGASITVGGRHIGNWLIGQVKNEATDEAQMMAYARDIGADEAEFRSALSEVTVMSTAQFQRVSDFLFRIASELSLKAYQNVQQARFIAERKRAEEELDRYREHLEDLVTERTAQLAVAKDEAEAASRAKSLFLANMSHELRTPMNAILGFAGIMARDSDATPKQKENLAVIGKSGEHLLAIINDILDLAKIESGRIGLEPCEFDLRELLDDLVTMLRVRAEAKGLELQLDQHSSFPRYVRTDPAKLRQIIINLVGNAIKYTDEGMVRVDVGVDPASGAGGAPLLYFAISDTGIGISEADQQRVFEPFVQIVQSQGTGLGLTITQQYVALLGGSIRVMSTPGQGSTFRFTIAYEPVLSDASPKPEAPAGSITGIPDADRYRVLIVEDQPENRLLLRDMLGHYGFQIREARDGKEGVKAVREWRPHVVFLDRRMPEMDGIAAARAIRELPDAGDVVVVAVTAHAFREERQEMLDAGCDAFLAKPFSLEELVAVVSNHLPVTVLRSTSEAAAAAPAGTLDPAAAARLPAALRTDLEDALVRLDLRRIEELCQAVERLDGGLGSALRDHAGRFDYTPIIEMLREVPEGTH